MSLYPPPPRRHRQHRSPVAHQRRLSVRGRWVVAAAALVALAGLTAAGVTLAGHHTAPVAGSARQAAPAGAQTDIPPLPTASAAPLNGASGSGPSAQTGPAQSPPSPSTTAQQPPPGGPGHFALAFSDSFTKSVPLGAFSDCDHNTDTKAAYCGGLNGYPSVAASWWAYPPSWPDTATQRHYPVGGHYDPATTIWISGGQMHIKMWRGAGGDVHSATVVPKAAMGSLYGAYEETFRVHGAGGVDSPVPPGYKSAHLLWPDANGSSAEIDFPENSWDTTISAFNHPSDGSNQDAFDSGARWTRWHTSVIEWTPGDIRFFLDGKLVGESHRGVMNTPANWDIQNESSLDGESAPPNSAAQMDIASVAYYRFIG